MKLEILSPEKALFDGDVHSITAIAPDGQFQLLENHAPLVSTLVAGDIKITTSSCEKKTIHLEGGLIETNHNKTVILIG